ncbi:response regulator transcription factor [Fulvivirgaceae bacterium PWU4]|uniref:Response regulator transcription factor n=2 Tax=Chryseosolibacter histidini TaxID=2782349 RepID=A0AAP2DJT9_9BACT|nr:response regulator transcription factor [Chryseosolibacter histidini]MBT1697620.1 response regulator transcription factor [Chryseosolibacter histidini]
MTCIAVDDEPLALDLLEDNIKKIPFLKLLRTCSNAIEANHFLQENPVDLLFLDIQMPGITGIQFLNGLSKNPPLVIFITAYEKYAIESYNLDVVDYLLKPVSFERFLKGVNKAYEQFNFRKNPPVQASASPDFLFVNSEYNLVKIDIQDVVYVEGLKDYIKIFLLSSPRPVITRMSMKSMEEKLPSDQFLRVHKSFIVSLKKIVSIRKGRINLLKTQIPISDHYKENLYRIVDPSNLQSKDSAAN